MVSLADDEQETPKVMNVKIVSPTVSETSKPPSGVDEVSPTFANGGSATESTEMSRSYLNSGENTASSSETAITGESGKPELKVKERPKLDNEVNDAFQEHDSKPNPKRSVKMTPTSTNENQRGEGMMVHPDTPIPNSDVNLRLLRKFAYKSRAMISVKYGGTKSLGVLRYFMGSPKEDPTFVPYRQLMDILLDGDGSDSEIDDNREDVGQVDRTVESIMGQSGDTMARARRSVGSFCHLLSVWGHASSRYFEKQDRASQKAFSQLLCLGMDTAAELVAHGCLDGVQLCISADVTQEYYGAVNVISESVLVADITLEASELAAMKFLLCAGCREIPGDQALLRGTHLLQTIRMLYHIYLTTESEANRTTARASLQQLVTSVFARLVRTEAPRTKRSDQFPSENHRDAFLVLRSICKLSMRNLPDPNLHSHVGLQSSGSNVVWDGTKVGGSNLDKSFSERDNADESQAPVVKEQPSLIYTHAIHPALESKILALELLQYVLENVKFTRVFVQRSGPQFQNAIRNYLCVSLLKNCTSDNTIVVNLSLRMFALLVRNFRTILKSEVEAFVTNVFFVILDSKNSPIEHKSLVVTLFEEICSDPTTLAEIFLNYDCDLSAVDLFHRIVNTLSKVARSDMQEQASDSSLSFLAGAGAARLEKLRIGHRELRLDAMRALRQVLASLQASIVEPMASIDSSPRRSSVKDDEILLNSSMGDESIASCASTPERPGVEKKNLVQIYDSKKKRREEEAEVILRFNQKPSAGISYASKCGHISGDDATDVARFLLKNKDVFEKTQIGEYLGREPEYQNGFSLKVLHEYVRQLDFLGLVFDEAIRFYLSGFRLPGEAQKIDRIMEKFAERFTEQNPEIFPTADVAFILAFSIIMLNTDLHNPAIKEERRMTRDGFIRNNRGICDGQDLPKDFLYGIFDRIKENPISLKEDDEAREKVGEKKGNAAVSLPTGLSPASFFTSHLDDMDRTRETNFQKERDHIVRTTESLLKRRRHGSYDHGKPQRTTSKSGSTKSAKSHRFVRTEDSGLRDEYVSPMFEVTWGPALVAFATAMESANGTVGALSAIASDEELEIAAENAAETIEVCLTGFRCAISTAGLCGNNTARDAFMLALSRFSQLGTGVLLEPRHVRCIQTLLSLAKDDGELLGASWEHVFKALSEVNRFHQLFHLMARNDRAVAAAAERRQRLLSAREKKRDEREKKKEARMANAEARDSSDNYLSDVDSVGWSENDASLTDTDIFFEDDSFGFEDEMDKREIDEANARVVYAGVSEVMIEAVYQRSSSLSAPAVKEFVFQLCRVSRMEISVKGYGGHVGSDSNTIVDLTQVHYRHFHSLLGHLSNSSVDQFHHSQPNIYNLQKLVEVTHYNMDSRPRLLFTEIWSTVSGHLTSTALHSNQAVAMYAVDSFRQLSIQFLQRGETEGFEFQRRFLKPLETVISRSEHSSTKELLLKCVERIVLMFGSSTGDDATRLRSGWVSVLQVLGIAGSDHDLPTAQTGFNILQEELKGCLKLEGSNGGTSDDRRNTNVIVEHFLEVVDALLNFVVGVHVELALKGVDLLIALCEYLDDNEIPSPIVKRKTSHYISEEGNSVISNRHTDLELWWPILMGLSKAVGHSSGEIRSKSLQALFKIIGESFAPDQSEKMAEEVQTLKLIFRGVMAPILEFGYADSETGNFAPLPANFERFLTSDDCQDQKEAKESWVETSFDEFADGCVAICLQVMEVCKDDSIVEEVFGILNSCLLSDSGALAVRGLRRLERFVIEELNGSVREGTWATVSHMLGQTLAVRGLPQPRDRAISERMNGTISEKQETSDDALKEFVLEDKLFPGRRFVFSNATMVICHLLCNEEMYDSIAMNWRIFLIESLDRGIDGWELAASLLSSNCSSSDDSTCYPPHYLENVNYGQKWMVSLLSRLSVKEASMLPGSDVEQVRKTIVNLTQKLLSSFIAQEQLRKEGNDNEKVYAKMKENTLRLLESYLELSDEHLQDLPWILSVVVSSCSQSIDEDVGSTLERITARISLENGAQSESKPSTGLNGAMSNNKTASQSAGI